MADHRSLGISWKDRITNVEVRARTGQQTMDNILRERRLRCLGHVFCMDHQRIPQQALYWQVPGYKRGPGRPRANWRGVVSKDLWEMGFTWEEAEVAALDRHRWRRSVAQCVQYDTGWIKVKDKITVSLSTTAGPLYKVTQTVQLSGNEMLNIYTACWQEVKLLSVGMNQSCTITMHTVWSIQVLMKAMGDFNFRLSLSLSLSLS